MEQEPFELSRFEQELVRRLRALPFEVQQHVSRYVLRLQKEHGTVPADPTAARPGQEAGSVVWTMTRDELARMRKHPSGDEEPPR